MNKQSGRFFAYLKAHLYEKFGMEEKLPVATQGYRHCLDGEPVNLPIGKVVCIGRNYADHAKELNNPIPAEPILFIKPATSLVSLEQPFSIPQDRGQCHFETELAVLIGQPLTRASLQNAAEAIEGVGIALDLTLRDLQQRLKEKGHPWEKAKAFDGSCPASGFVSFDGDLQNLGIRIYKNGEVKQDGNTGDMITPVVELVAYASQHFSLLPGDVVLTGTPAGVGPLEPDDQLIVELDSMIRIKTMVDSA